jgi:serine/threonine protein kinase/Flp pilus assembly protein TadD
VTPERWRQVTDLFHAVLASPDARTRLLDAADDPTLRAEVEAMLAAHGAAHGFGSEPALARTSVASLLDVDTELDPERVEALFDRGDAGGAPYRIVRRIGEGGMGVVYEAEQQRPVRRNVALKLIRAGLGGDQAIARFQSERQALALMNHPSIASVYEAGATRDGRPFFAMELVPGTPVTEFCDEHRLPLRARLELFIAICDGVQHAHQKGVIHRDLKPSNILVTTHGDPVPKIIDFGVAKMMSTAQVKDPRSTEAGMIVGTPVYMSPEQADLTNQDIDTRSDVYALGVVLHEMLVGVLPFDAPSSSDLHEIRRVIREVDPVPPSSRARRLSSPLALPPAEIDALAKRRGTDPTSLVRQLAGDLDWITLKALARDRAHRYESASALALDVRRHLDDQPIQARAPSLGYAIGKFVRRHRWGVAASALIAVAILGGTLLAALGLLQARTAEREARTAEREARTEAAKAVAINRFLQQTLGSADPRQGQGRDTTVRDALGAAVVTADQAFRDQPEILAAVLNTIGRTYVELGSYPDAEPILRRALLLRNVPGIPPQDFAESLSSLAGWHFSSGQYPQAEALFREALAVRRALADDELAVSESLNDLAMTLQRKANDHAGARPLLEESLSIRTRRLGERHRDIAQSLNNLAMLYFRMGELDRAEPLFRRAIVLNRELLGPDHPELSSSSRNLGLVLRDKGNLTEAETLFRQDLDNTRRHLGDDHPHVAGTHRELAKLLLRMGKIDDAERHYRDALAIQARRFPPGHWELAATRSAIAGCLIERADYPGAEAILLEALPVMVNAIGDGHAATQACLRRLVDLYERWKAPDKAEEYRRRLQKPR